MQTDNSSVDEPQKTLIATQSRAKISHLLSYPVGAEQLSEALVNVPQFSLLRLHFFAGIGFGLKNGLRENRRRYEFLRVEYLLQASPVDKYPIGSLYPRPPQLQWELVVQPVPRTERNDVKAYITTTALPQIRTWLLERGGQAKQGSDILAFFREREYGNFESAQATMLHSTVRQD